MDAEVFRVAEVSGRSFSHYWELDGRYRNIESNPAPFIEQVAKWMLAAKELGYVWRVEPQYNSAMPKCTVLIFDDGTPQDQASCDPNHGLAYIAIYSQEPFWWK